MTLTQLQYVVAIAETKSMNKAAAALFVSQPALSGAIKDLEEELQTELFIRTNKGIVITTEGQEFLSYARQMVELGNLVEERFVNKTIAKKKFSVSMQHYSFAVEAFIKLAKKLNKVVIYDIDDLVIDTKYTDTIKYLDTMSKEERESYEQGVNNMQRVLKMCDAVITTTERLAKELEQYSPRVFVNRNTASEKMLELSEKAYKKIKQAKNEKNGKVKLGYFSGSITHNDDFRMIQPAIVKY